MTVTPAATAEHACHFYTEDASLVATVSRFLEPAFTAGGAIVSIGTPHHLAAIDDSLRQAGHDVDRAREEGRYIELDAREALDRLTRTGLPTREAFETVVGRIVAKAAADHGDVRAFGEIVSLLWRDGKRAAALRLEELWNEALGYHPLALICGYSVRAFRDPAEAAGLAGVVGAHTEVIAGPSA